MPKYTSIVVLLQGVCGLYGFSLLVLFQVALVLPCEWSECTEVYSDMKSFVNHVTSHLQDVMNFVRSFHQTEISSGKLSFFLWCLFVCCLVKRFLLARPFPVASLAMQLPPPPPCVSSLILLQPVFSVCGGNVGMRLVKTSWSLCDTFIFMHSTRKSKALDRRFLR